ncbi:MAG TPA: GspH/FimT family pseudopilin [Longimicrobiales bacterium]
MPAGFTLLEAVVVLVIIGVVAAVSAPALRSPGGDGAAAAARALAAALREARNLAAERGRAVAFHLDPRTGRYAAVTVPAPFEAPDTLRSGRLAAASGAAVLRCDAPCVLTFDPLRRGRGGPIGVVQGDERYEVTADAWSSTIHVRRR